MAADSNAPVRGTQSFVHTMSACWRRPSLTALEVLWRWGFGAPATAVVVVEAMRILRETPLDNAALQRMSLLDPMSAVDTVSQAASVLLPPVLRVAVWLAPVLLIGWVVASAIGRGVVLHRVDGRMHLRPRTLIVLQAARTAALVGSFAVWFACVRGAAGVCGEWTDRGGSGAEPGAVLRADDRCDTWSVSPCGRSRVGRSRWRRCWRCCAIWERERACRPRCG
jgi:hypothetical protein